MMSLKKQWFSWSTDSSNQHGRLEPEADDQHQGVVSPVQHRLDYFFDSALSGLALEGSGGQPACMENTRSFDFQETEEKYELLVDVSEWESEHISLSLECDQLTLQYNGHQDAALDGKYRGGLSDDRAGTFIKTIHLPKDADREAISACIERNLLTISIGRCDEAVLLPRTIKIHKR